MIGQETKLSIRWVFWGFWSWWKKYLVALTWDFIDKQKSILVGYKMIWKIS